MVRISGSYDQVNRLCSQIADERQWGFVNVNLRPYYAEGSKTVGYEIAEQLGWRLPDNVVVPMAGGSLITKIKKAFDELILLGLVEAKPCKIFGAQATGCSPISTAVKAGNPDIEPQKPSTWRARWPSATRPTGTTPSRRLPRRAAGRKIFRMRMSSSPCSSWPRVKACSRKPRAA